MNFELKQSLTLSPQTAPTSSPLAHRIPKMAKGKRHSPDTQSDLGNGKWTDEEHRRFLHALDMYGNCWKKVEEFVGTRTCAQIRSHCQKYFRRMRNKTLQELRRTNQLRGKVFIVTKEYFNYSGCAHQPMEPEMRIVQRTQPELGSIKTEPQQSKEPCFDQILPNFQREAEPEARFEIFDEPKLGNDFDEGLFGSHLGFCEENAYQCLGNEVAFHEEYDDYSMPILARISYES